MKCCAAQAGVWSPSFQQLILLSFTVLALNTNSIAVGNPQPCKCLKGTLTCRRRQQLDPKETCGNDTLKVLVIEDHDMESLQFLPSPCTLQELHASYNELRSIKELESCQEVQGLDVSYNSFLKVTRDSFPQLPKLRYLSIRSLNLQKIPSDVLQYYPELIELDLSGNRFSSISKDDFVALPNLRTLKLSKIGLSNTLLDADTFSELNHLSFVDMSYNSMIDCPEGYLSSLNNIEVFIFHNNSLSNSCWDAISKMEQLKKLVVSRNQIVSLPPKTFSKMTHLEWLGLENNNIEILAPGIFDELCELKALTLSRNKIQSISNVFSLLHKLEVIKLESNPINELPNGIFNGLNKLKILNLKATAITELSSGIFSDLQSLEEIDLSETKIKYISSNVFEGLHSLQRICINKIGLEELPQGLLNGLHELLDFEAAFNKLQNISPGYFRDQKHLISLDLTSNRISQLPDDAFSGLQSLRMLFLSSNPLMEFPDAVRGLHSLERFLLMNCDVPAVPIYDVALWPYLKLFVVESKSIKKVPEEGVLRSWLDPPLQRSRRLHLLNPVSPPSAVRWALDDPTINVTATRCKLATLEREGDKGKAKVMLIFDLLCSGDEPRDWIEAAKEE